MAIDFETAAKLYSPIVVAIGTVWKLYVRRDKIREKQAKSDREIHQALVEATILKCDMERREDRKECATKYDILQKRLDVVQDAHNKTMADAFDRVADALEMMARGRKPQSDSDTHPTKKG